jgi:DNA polymerase-3 subunit alpha
MKIVGRRSLGMHPVYDIGLAETHNFLIADHFVAANCFNKSHSVAYGYVTYQTAYLKANYPVEYMAALLSSVSGEQDKVQRYIANCNNLGITVLPPDINRSELDFTPFGKQILFGLAGIKNLGMSAIEIILRVRHADGPFKSLADLCQRVDGRSVNKKSLEALILAGAFDGLQANRRQLVADLDLILDWSSRKAKEQASGQGNLLELLGGGAVQDTGNFDQSPKASPVDDYSPQEKLRLEKELLGFYISDHPLKVVGSSVKLMAPTNLSNLASVPEKHTMTAIALLLDIKEVTTKKGDRMAIVQLEDLTGTTEAVIFPKSYERVRQHLVKDSRLMIWGKVDRRDEQVQLIIDDMQPITSIRMVKVDLDKSQALDNQRMNELRQILSMGAGANEPEASNSTKVPVVASLGYSSKFVRFGPQYWIKNEAEVLQRLQAAGFKAMCETLVKE